MKDLTVEQLISLLQKFPKDATVCVLWEMFACSPVQAITYDEERNEVAIEHDN